MEGLVEDDMVDEMKTKRRINKQEKEKTRKEIMFTILVIKIILTKGEDEGLDEDLEEEAFMEPIFNVGKAIKYMCANKIKEGQTKDLKMMCELHIYKMMPNLSILKM